MPRLAVMPTRRLVLVPLAALLLAGCSSGPGGSVLFPQDNDLNPATRRVRQPVPPEGLPRGLDKRDLHPYIVEPGDTLLVQPADNSLDSPVRLPSDQPVLPDGAI